MVFRARQEAVMNPLRIILTAALVVALVLLLVHGDFVGLAASAVAAFLIQALLLRDLGKCLGRALPVLLFCAILAVLELTAHRSLSLLTLKTFACYAILSLGVQLMPWTVMARSVSLQSRFFAPVLFLLFVYHFTMILQEEVQRVLTAYRMAAPHPLRHGGLRALAYSLDALFRRCLVRTERFYAAQTLRGIAE
jgi:hypothetical protein